MKEEKDKSLEEKISEGLKLTKEKLLEFKKQKNSPLIVSKDGEIRELSPDKVK
jgi:hypothetical protein